MKAKTEYDEKTATVNMAYREIYGSKNIMIFLMAGDTSNKYYEKISLIAQKLKYINQQYK